MFLSGKSEIIFAALCLLIAGVIMFFFPKKLWNIKYKIMTNGGNPSEVFIAINKILGVISMLAGVYLLIRIIMI